MWAQGAARHRGKGHRLSPECLHLLCWRPWEGTGGGNRLITGTTEALSCLCPGPTPGRHVAAHLEHLALLSKKQIQQNLSHPQAGGNCSRVAMGQEVQPYDNVSCPALDGMVPCALPKLPSWPSGAQCWSWSSPVLGEAVASSRVGLACVLGHRDWHLVSAFMTDGFFLEAQQGWLSLGTAESSFMGLKLPVQASGKPWPVASVMTLAAHCPEPS